MLRLITLFLLAIHCLPAPAQSGELPPAVEERVAELTYRFLFPGALEDPPGEHRQVPDNDAGLAEMVTCDYRHVALVDLVERFRSAEPWTGPTVDCPSCKPGRPVTRDCEVCHGAKTLPCDTCTGPMAQRLFGIRAAAESEQHYGRLFWIGELLDVGTLAPDRKGWPIGVGHVHDEMFESFSSCWNCETKEQRECPRCEGDGERKCYACLGKGKVKRACADCGGAGVLPDPSALTAAQWRECSWCAGAGARPCGECVLSELELSQRRTTVLDTLSALIAGLPSCTTESGSFAVGLPGVKVVPCPTCLGERKAWCGPCEGTGEVRCHNCVTFKIKDPKTCTTCRGRAAPDCVKCEGKGERECPDCDGERERESVCTACQGFLLRACEGCFRSGTRHWELGAEIAAKADDPNRAVALQAMALERFDGFERERLVYQEFMGIDWVTGKILGLRDVVKDLEKRRKALGRDLDAYREEAAK